MAYHEHIIKVLGAGCESCHSMYDAVLKEVEVRGIDAEVKYITNLADMAIYGYIGLPAIVIDEQVKSKAKIMSEEEVHQFFEEQDL